MNLQPAKKHESVTILLVPYDGYSAFPRAVDALLRETRLPFELIIIEGGAPDVIRHDLEKRQERRKHIKIIYSNHRPRLNEAFNLGLPHIRTNKAFLMHNNLKVTPQWLENLLQHAVDRPGIICPYIPPVQGEGHKEAFEPDMQAFLITKEILGLLGEFDEKVASPLMGLDFSQWLKKQGIAIHRDPYTVLEHNALNNHKSIDMKMLYRQWDERQLHENVAYVGKKWGLKLQESKYLAWVQKKKHSHPSKQAPNATVWQELPMRPEFPKLSLKKFLQVLTKA